MPTERKSPAERMAIARSALTGTRQWRSRVTNTGLPAGIDQRSTIGRRYRDLVAEYSREVAACGDGEPLSQAEMVLVNQAAAITIRVEILQADIVTGAAVDDETIVRYHNALTRILDQLRGARRRQHKIKTGRPPSKDLAASVAEHFALRKASGRIKS